MSKYKRRFTKEQKLEIINYYKQHGAARASRRYEVTTTSIYNWRDILEQYGAEGLENQQSNVEKDPELERLRRENQALKTIIADKELELRIKNDLLKKSK